LSHCRPVASEARQSARCRAARCHLVAWFISQSFDLSQATMWHRDNTPHDNALFGVHRLRQDNKTKVRQRAVWHFVVLSLCTKSATIRYSGQNVIKWCLKRTRLRARHYRNWRHAQLAIVKLTLHCKITHIYLSYILYYNTCIHNGNVMKWCLQQNMNRNNSSFNRIKYILHMYIKGKCCCSIVFPVYIVVVSHLPL
jgi:hypothetical protein